MLEEKRKGAVVQWIGHVPAKLEIWVRFPAAPRYFVGFSPLILLINICYLNSLLNIFLSMIKHHVYKSIKTPHTMQIVELELPEAQWHQSRIGSKEYVEYAYKIPHNEGRAKLDSQQEQGWEQTTLDDFLAHMKPHGLELVKKASESPSGIDCQKYVYSHFGIRLSHSWATRELIVKGKHPHFTPTKDVKIAQAVGYSEDLNRLDNFDHWGICFFNDGQIVVESIWGKDGDLYRHPIEVVPSMYGNFVEFFTLR